MSERLDLSKIDVEEFLGKLGIDNIKVKGEEVFYSCPFEGHASGDLNPSTSMKQGTTQFNCFGCGMKGNAIHFLAEFEKISPIEAKKWLRREFFGGYNVPDGPFVEHIRGIIQTQEEPLARPRRLPPQDFVSRTYVDWTAVSKADPSLFYGWESYMLSRGFEPGHLEAWNIGYDDISERITIPIYDYEYGFEARVVGFKGRAWRPNAKPRYKVLGGAGYDFDTYDTSSYIYGLSYAAAHRSEHILVEGELNALAMWQMGWHGAMGISGKFLSPKQANMIVKHFSRVTILMDEVKDAVEAARQIGNRIPTKIVPKDLNGYGVRAFDPADCLMWKDGDDNIGRFIDRALPSQLVRV